MNEVFPGRYGKVQTHLPDFWVPGRPGSCQAQRRDCPLNAWPLGGCVYYMISLVRVFHCDGGAESAMCFHVPEPFARPLPFPGGLPSSLLLFSQIGAGHPWGLSEELPLQGRPHRLPCSLAVPGPVSAMAHFTCGWCVSF